ncbi:hypothetical protein LINPERHAP1_LOCUS24657 [Linum perenne]
MLAQINLFSSLLRSYGKTVEVIREENDLCIASFMSRSNSQEILHLELLAIRDGISLAKLMGYQQIILESDGFFAAKLV